MNYYDENDDRPKLYGGVAVSAYVIVIAAAMLLGHITIDKVEEPAMIIIELEEEPKRPQRTVVTQTAPRHENISTERDNSQQVTGPDEETRTVNQRAMFHSNTDGIDEEEDVGNPYSREGKENTASGDGGGLNPVGNDQLDEGLRGRGLVGNLPLPEYPGNTSGKIVVRVAVDQHGVVTSAAYEPKGSTSSDAALIAAAIAAAKKARFTESRSFVQGGTITYSFKLN